MNHRVGSKFVRLGINDRSSLTRPLRLELTGALILYHYPLNSGGHNNSKPYYLNRFGSDGSIQRGLSAADGERAI
jgi:hypothetical protein